MASSNRKEIISEQYIIKKYMEYTLENSDYPKSVYSFCKEKKIKEEAFYRYFGSMDAISKGIWNTLFSTTIDAINANEAYSNLSMRDKLLTFFYTFFELLALNRNYIVKELNYRNVQLENIGQLRSLRNHIKSFARELIEIDMDENPISAFTEDTWLQFLYLLRVWINDVSVDYEETDVSIGKSVDRMCNVWENSFLNNFISFDKILWEEKSMWN